MNIFWSCSVSRIKWKFSAVIEVVKLNHFLPGYVVAVPQAFQLVCSGYEMVMF